MKRLLYAAVLALTAWTPVSAGAAPSPSPTLDKVLAPAPAASWVEDKPAAGVIEGPFTAQQYIALGTTTNGAAAKATLESDGFLAGYGKTWIQHSTQRALIEAVIAFSGAAGAKKWLAASEVADKADPAYKGSLTISGIDTYYGARYAYPATKVFGHAYVFVKGNDFYAVVTAALQDDKGVSAATQASAQYKFAPAYTVPPAKWPEAAKASSAFNLGLLLERVLIFILVAGVLAVVVGLVIRSRRRSAGFDTSLGSTIPGDPAPMVELSPDGNFWWDGQAWRDAGREAPPDAHRSPDGGYWWDGGNWRPVPPSAS